MEKNWKIGELAKQTGLTVRTLHHYDKICLLRPSYKTTSGHRLYTENDLKRLLQIVSLKQLGLSLHDIKQLIDKPNFDSLKLLQDQLNRLNEKIRSEERLRDQLTEIYELLQTQQKVTPQQFMKVIQMMKISYSNHFHPEQVKEIKNNYQSNRNSKESKDLISRFKREQEKGTGVDDPIVVELAKQWRENILSLTSDFQSISYSAESYYAENPVQALNFDMERELYFYIREALKNLTTLND